MRTKTPSEGKAILKIHESTLQTLSDVERMFLEQFVREGRAAIVADTGATT